MVARNIRCTVGHTIDRRREITLEEPQGRGIYKIGN